MVAVRWRGLSVKFAVQSNRPRAKFDERWVET